MRVTCENCNSLYELPIGQEGRLGCPVCKHIRVPRAINTEDTIPYEDYHAEDFVPPARTMVFYPDAEQKDDPTTAIQQAIQGEKKCLPKESQVFLQVLEGDQNGSLITLSKSRSVLGRSGQTDITFRDPEVSSVHCAIELYEKVAVLRDLGSTNGTILNGYLIKEDFVKDGDKIQIGGTTFQFCLKPK